MNESIKKIIKQNPLLLLLARKAKAVQEKWRRPVSGKNNQVTNHGKTVKVKYDIVGDNNRIEIMNGALVSGTLIFMRGNNHVLQIGENCQYKGGAICFEDNNCSITIGSNTTVESADLAAVEPGTKIAIGKDCMLSARIEFRTSDSHSIIDNTTQKRVNPAKNITVDDHVWIGAYSTILKGVTIGRNSVIGMNSVVTKDVPEHSIAAGVPAKVIKDNINWSRERIYDQ